MFLLILTICIDQICYCITSYNCIVLYISGFNMYGFIYNVYTIVERPRTNIWMQRYIRNVLLTLLLLLLSNVLLGGAS